MRGSIAAIARAAIYRGGAVGGDIPSGAVLWAVASDLGLSDTDPVDTWTARIGTSLTGSGASRPTFAASAIGGLAAIRLNGATQYLLMPQILAGASTVAIVYSADTLPGASSFRSIYRFKNVTFTEALHFNYAGYQPYGIKSDYLSTDTSVGCAGPISTSPLSSIVTYNGGTQEAVGSYTARIDGASRAILSCANYGATGTDQGSLGARVTSGGVGSAFFDGDVAEIVAYDRALSAADVLALDAYLTARYSL